MSRLTLQDVEEFIRRTSQMQTVGQLREHLPEGRYNLDEGHFFFWRTLGDPRFPLIRCVFIANVGESSVSLDWPRPRGNPEFWIRTLITPDGIGLRTRYSSTDFGNDLVVLMGRRVQVNLHKGYEGASNVSEPTRDDLVSSVQLGMLDGASGPPVLPTGRHPLPYGRDPGLVPPNRDAYESSTGGEPSVNENPSGESSENEEGPANTQ